ncbi:MAG: HesA/MoeB/ThiF family protein [Thermoplasmatales archaeon]|nr:HesA/MoeB/ThiF family protein [Thermoplasmatales archaeon]
MGRHSRQIPLFGDEGQTRIAASKAAIIGCGGLGCNVATQLALAGVGTLLLIDYDRPSESDFNRQFPHILNPEMMKCDSLAHWVSRISGTGCETVPEGFGEDNFESVLGGCDVAVDCLDNNDARLALNRACHASGIPLVHGAADGFLIQTTTCVGRPCLECFLKPGGAYGGPSVGTAVSALAGMQATEALRLLSGSGAANVGFFVSIDLSSGSYRRIPLVGSDDCPICNTHPGLF